MVAALAAIAVGPSAGVRSSPRAEQTVSDGVGVAFAAGARSDLSEDAEFSEVIAGLSISLSARPSADTARLAVDLRHAANAAAARGVEHELLKVLELAMLLMRKHQPPSVIGKLAVVKALQSLAGSSGATEDLLSRILREFQNAPWGLRSLPLSSQFERVLSVIASSVALTPELVAKVIAATTSTARRRHLDDCSGPLIALARNPSLGDESLIAVVDGAEALVQAADEVSSRMADPFCYIAQMTSASPRTMERVFTACQNIWDQVRASAATVQPGFYSALGSVAQNPVTDAACLGRLAEFVSHLPFGGLLNMAGDRSATKASLLRVLHMAGFAFVWSRSSVEVWQVLLWTARSKAADLDILERTLSSFMPDRRRRSSAPMEFLRRFARIPALDLRLLERVFHLAKTLSLGAEDHNRLLDLLAAVAAHNACSLDLLREVVDMTERQASSALRISVAVALRGMSVSAAAPRFARFGAARAALVARALMSAVRLRPAARVLQAECPRVLRLVAETPSPVAGAARRFQHAGLSPELIADIRRLSEDPGASEACGAVVALCAETADAETAVALWRAVCAADAGVRLAAAEGFARYAQDRRIAISNRDLLTVGLCLRPRPDDEPGASLAKLLLAVLDGAEVMLRSSTPTQGWKTLCATLEARVEEATSALTFDAQDFRSRLAAVCGTAQVAAA